MDKSLKIRIWKRVFTYLILIAIIITGYVFFNPQISLGFFLLVAALKMMIVELSVAFYPGKAGKSLLVLNFLLTIVTALILVTLVLITPFSVYSYFFNVASRNFLKPIAESFYVGTLFFSVIVYFSLIVCESAIKNNRLTPLASLFSIASGLFLIIYQHAVFFLILVFGLLAFALLNFKKQFVNIIAAVLICGCIAFVSYSLNPEPKGRDIVEQVFFPEVRNFINFCFPGLPLMLDIPGYGFSSHSAKLGGKTVLSPVPVFEVDNPEGKALYLATEIFDTYNKKSWSQSKKPQNFSSTKAETKTDKSRFSRPLHLKVLTEVYPAIPFTYDTLAFELDQRIYDIDNQNWRGMMIDPGLGKNRKLTLYRSSSNIAISDIDLKPYLSLPSGLSERIKNLAMRWDIPGADQDQILKGIQDFLASHFIYDLNAPDIEKDEDFLDKFLFDKNWGYCTHFATAFTILARLNHVPVRYVSGFLVYFDAGKTNQIVTARSAHAWPEVWTKEKGWQVWEVTRAVNRNYYNSLSQSYLDYLRRYMIQGDEIALNDITRQQLKDLLGIEFAPFTEFEKSFGMAWLYPVLLTLLLFLIVFTCILIAKKKIRLSKIFRPNRQAPWVKYANAMVKKFRNVPGPEKQGWLKWKKDVIDNYGVMATEFHEWTYLVIKAAYTTQSLSEQELALLKARSKKKIPFRGPQY
ncbi:MAG: hypothetical protein JXR70_06375 [Spirochaetales bacterium]|nr:hypothetical protein [Spirochaetales bacterium]